MDEPLTVIDPDLVKAVNDTKQPIFIDRFGQQTTNRPRTGLRTLVSME